MNCCLGTIALSDRFSQSDQGWRVCAAWHLPQRGRLPQVREQLARDAGPFRTPFSTRCAETTDSPRPRLAKRAAPGDHRLRADGLETLSRSSGEPHWQSETSASKNRVRTLRNRVNRIAVGRIPMAMRLQTSAYCATFCTHSRTLMPHPGTAARRFGRVCIPRASRRGGDCLDCQSGRGKLDWMRTEGSWLLRVSPSNWISRDRKLRH